MSVVTVDNLRIHLATDRGTLEAVDGVSYSIDQGKTLGVIGESGSGKTIAAKSLMRLLPHVARIVEGTILIRRKASGESGDATLDVAALAGNDRLLRRVRGREVAMVFQEPMTSLSPVHSIGNQLMETLLLHRTRDKTSARHLATDLLAKVGISTPGERLAQYPHELSGGMRQRVMIAMALAGEPGLLIADEPTTALDTTVQAQILDLLQSLQDELGMAIQYITHNIGVVGQVSHDVAVMYLGRIVEMGTCEEVLFRPQHPYTRQLLKSVPSFGSRTEKLSTIPGSVPVPIGLGPQCGFVSRCADAIAGQCDRQVPALIQRAPGHKVRCFLHGNDVEEAPTRLMEKAARVEPSPLVPLYSVSAR